MWNWQRGLRRNLNIIIKMELDRIMGSELNQSGLEECISGNWNLHLEYEIWISANYISKGRIEHPQW